MLLPLGFLGTFLLNNFLKETYSSRKLELEKSIENLLDKNVDLGDYVGIRFLGISLGNSKINDKKNIDSEIKAKNVYVGIMPFRSFLKQKWIVKISPKKAAIDVDRDGDVDVVGSRNYGHLKGIKGYLESQLNDIKSLEELDSIPAPSRWPKLIPWFIVALVFIGFSIGFNRAPELGWQLVITRS